MNTLFEIKNEAIKKWQDVESEEQEKELKEAIDIAVKEQSVDVINALKNMVYYITALRDVEGEYRAKRQAIEQKYNKAREYIKQNMVALGYEKIETPFGSLSIRKCPSSVEIINENQIPEEYMKTKITREVDKNKILDAFRKNGEVIDGTRIVTGNTTIVLK